MMSFIDNIRDEIEASVATKQALLRDAGALVQMEALASTCLKSLRSGGKIIFAGNGGSFADAQHLSAEFVSRFRFDRAPLASLALGTNNSAISAIGNDYGYDRVFERELEAVGKAGDVFIGISTSGNSTNILLAAEKAISMGISCFCMTGRTGGKLVGLCECLHVPSDETARIQECHITVGHIICGLVESQYFQ
jgi:D-sedoheptulose 7-phosphate isomerase